MTETEANAATQDEDHFQPTDNGAPSPLRTLCEELHDKVFKFLESEAPTETLKNVQGQCWHTITIISDALTKYPYVPISPLQPPPAPQQTHKKPSLSALSLSYNGGKDCLVLLILYLASLSRHPHLPPSLPAILIPPPHPFPSIDTFVAASSQKYHLSLSRYSSPSMSTAFRSYLSSSAGQPIKAIFVGTRRTDPHGGKLSAYDVTDRGWPEFMRVHPVLEWRYAEVWAFLRYLGVEYCGLYDEGYTSLGGTNDTQPNPALRVVEEGGRVWYRPAYELVEDEQERLGRDW